MSRRSLTIAVGRLAFRAGPDRLSAVILQDASSSALSSVVALEDAGNGVRRW